jgi:hypothetical protein
LLRRRSRLAHEIDVFALLERCRRRSFQPHLRKQVFEQVRQLLRR